MNFATLKGLAIPEGNVTQITDASGNVLWKKAPSGATITLTTSSAVYEKAITIGGQSYSGNAVITVPLGTVVEFRGFTQVVMNNTAVGGSTYDYTVTGDIGIHCSGTQPTPYFTVYVATIIEF